MNRKCLQNTLRKKNCPQINIVEFYLLCSFFYFNCLVTTFVFLLTSLQFNSNNLEISSTSYIHISSWGFQFTINFQVYHIQCSFLDTTITFEELEKTPSKRWFKCGCKYMFDSLKSDPKLVSKNEGKLLKTKQFAIECSTNG